MPMMLAPRLALILSAALLCAAQPDEVTAEADRLEAQARVRGSTAGGAVDLMRLTELWRWLPAGDVEARLHKASKDRKRDPLVRAAADWGLRSLALSRMDIQAAQAAAARLGLITGFSYRAGPAPPVTAVTDPKGWSTWPADGNAGELRLEAFVRPNREVRATLMTHLSGSEGPAVLRLGYDDAVKVWLNGDEVYASGAEHRSWLDQAAIPIHLRPDHNRLVIEVQQRSGAWRLIARVTDPVGRPLKVKADPAAWGPLPETAGEGPEPERIRHLWPELLAAAKTEPPNAQDLRDLADYARRSGLPDNDQVTPQVAMEGAWEADPSPRTLRAWLRLIPSDERGDVRSRHTPKAPFAEADRYSALHLRLLEAWGHYYARRHHQTRGQLKALIADAPGFAPAWRLWAIFHEDLDLPHTAAALLGEARARWPGRYGLRIAHINALRSAGRITELLAELQALRGDGQIGADQLYLLGTLHAERGETDEAVAVLTEVFGARPAMWTHAFEAAEVLAGAERPAEAIAQLRALDAVLPGDRVVSERLARLLIDQGDTEEAVALLHTAVKASPGDEDLRRYLDRLTKRPPRPQLGPDIEELARIESPEAVAHVLYHHAKAEVDAQGRAVRRTRRVVRILNEEGARRYASWELAYVPGAQNLELEEARLIRKGAPPLTPSRSDRDLSEPEYRLYYDLRAEVLTFPRPQPGDIVEVAWRLSDLDPDPAFPGYYGDLAYLQESVPRATSIVEIAGEAAPRLAFTVVHRGLKFSREGSRVVARDVPAAPFEQGMPGASSSRAYVHLSTEAGWGEVDARYRKLLQGRDAPTAALAQLAREWTQGATTDEEKVGRLYAEVAHRTRYVGLEFGTHSFQPEQPAITLSRGYGDCKDKATLLIALSRALGIEANLTLVRTRQSGDIEPEPASLAIFDHALVYLPGMDRFVDPTVDRNDPWTLPPSDQGAMSFVIGLDAKPRHIPPQSAAHNLSEWVVRVGPEGKGTLEWTTRGHPATVARRALEAESNRREILERALAARFPGARLQAPQVSGLAPAFDPVVVNAEVQLPPFHPNPEGFDVPAGGAVWRLVERHARAARRQTPLQLEFNHTERMRLELTLPEGAKPELPEPVQLKSAFGKASVQTTAKPGQLLTAVEVVMDQPEVAPADYAAFRSWLAKADAAMGRRVRVRRGAVQ